VALLDARFPNWRGAFNPVALNMAAYDRCVLGQVFGDYREGFVVLGLLMVAERVKCGFSVSDTWDDRRPVDYTTSNKNLTETWKAVVADTSNKEQAAQSVAELIKELVLV
jgi:hypothetical protein